MTSQTFNASFIATDWRGVALSNLTLSPFVLDGVLLASVEGFIQGIKFPPGDARREQAFVASGWVAKKAGQGAARDVVHWQSSQLPFGSPAHHRLVERALRARFAQNEGLCQVLRSTDSLRIVHETDEAHEPAVTSLPAAEFCRVLTEIRAALTA